ncbi:MAG: type II toxin-antitoxin system RelE/ParE family toxin [Candidatus Cloacimonetes bacterium]|nr:type II toxin-antitoxin system RelE/ParE family toxin [Candidatus Cloacimonadota bacterium]
MEYKIELYEKKDGRVPVLEFIKCLNSKQQAKIYREIDLLERFGNDLHYPHLKSIKGELHKELKELRIVIASDIFRIFYFMHVDNTAVLLHGIIKKTQRTPQKELDIAASRMKDYIRRTNNAMG